MRCSLFPSVTVICAALFIKEYSLKRKTVQEGVKIDDKEASAAQENVKIANLILVYALISLRFITDSLYYLRSLFSRHFFV
jgi:hypothetical protein